MMMTIATPPVVAATAPDRSPQTALADAAGGRGNPIPMEDLPVLLMPFVNAKLNRIEDPASEYGAFLPLPAEVDISHGACTYIGADVRSVGRDGVGVFFYDRVDIVPWSDVYRVTIREIDDDGHLTIPTRYRVVSRPRRALDPFWERRDEDVA
jgi:hypothetical protein